MQPRDLTVLDRYPLLPRALHGVERPDTRSTVLERALPAPFVPAWSGWRRPPTGAPPQRIPARQWRDAPEVLPAEHAVACLEPLAMRELVPLVRELGDRGPAALLLELAPLAATEPFGPWPWRPRQREELAELAGAAGVPLWVDGVASAADAEVAAEAGAQAVVVRSALGRHLEGPATAQVLPEILDAVAGTVGVFVGGPLRGGVDAFRYLALGAELLLPDADLDPDRAVSELRYAMRLTGCATLAEIGYEALFAPLYEDAP